jgi:hypothetical protein
LEESCESWTRNNGREKKSTREQCFDNLKFALGKLGWSAYQYYTSLPVEYAAAVEGYIEKQTEQAKVIRFASFRIAESMAGSKAVGSIERFWPLADEEPVKKVEPMTKDRYEAIMKRHNIKMKTDG